jgi:hypothetical protein
LHTKAKKGNKLMISEMHGRSSIGSEEFSRLIREKIYACKFCSIVAHTPKGVDGLKKKLAKRFYLAHLKERHGLTV